MARAQVERDEVEWPTIAQLMAMGWTHIPGKQLGTLSADRPMLTEIAGQALRRINRRAVDDEPWMGEADVSRSLSVLASVSLAEGLGKANFIATDLLLSGIHLPGPSAAHGGPSATVQVVEWHEERLKDNSFTVVDQLRVKNRSGDVSVLDLVLFVNGVPLVVIECKRSDLADPLHSAVLDLRHYAGDPLDDDTREDTGLAPPSGVPELFRTVQLIVAATAETAYVGTVTSGPEHYHPWRSVEPEDKATLTAELPLDTGPLNERHKLIGVVLRPKGLLTLVRHYIVPLPVDTGAGRTQTIKAVARHQQYRAAEKAVRKLLTGRTRDGLDLEDERGGVIWHTQGSGKSLTMTFLVRRIHLHHRLSEFTVVVVTDRRQLQTQLARTLKHSESDVETAETATQMEGLLRDGGRRVVFAMIQKYGSAGFSFTAEDREDGDDRNLVEEYKDAEETRNERRARSVAPVPNLPECNTSSDILVLVDEAHRSHTSLLHAALRKAIPNAAKIGFTGTPIMTERAEDTRRIFSGGPDGAFLDTYRMSDAERDGVVVRIRYEGRTGEGSVTDAEGLDRSFDDLVSDRTEEERRQLLNRWPTERDVAESRSMIEAKAKDMLEHWVTTVLPGGGFKAQVAAVSRRAAVAYHHALRSARDALMDDLSEFRPESVTGIPMEDLSRKTRYLFTAYQYRALLSQIDFVPIISEGAERKHGLWLHWTNPVRQEAYIDRFHQEFPTPPPDHDWNAAVPFSTSGQGTQDPGTADDNPWSQEGVEQPERTATSSDPVHPDSPIAFLIVKSMLLTGFDAPREQVLYLDRPIRDAELLQAVARVNRPMPGKDIGYVVDYYGVFEHLADALADYRRDDVDDTMRSMSEEVGALAPAAEAVRGYLSGLDVDDAELTDAAAVRAAALEFEDETVRLGFDEILHQFLAVLERVLPHEHGLRYAAEARRWTMLQKRIRTLHRDGPGGAFTMRLYGRKVRTMVADHLEGPQIDEVIAPVSLTSPLFDERVNEMPPREAAAEMQHALRFHLEERVKREDPEKYARLSQRLEEILREAPDRFEEQIEEYGTLLDEVRQGDEDDPRLSGLSPLEQRLYRMLDALLEENPGLRKPGEETMRNMVADVRYTAVRIMGKVSYQGHHQDVKILAGGIHQVLVEHGVRPTTSEWALVEGVSEQLAAHAEQNRAAFLAYGRRQ